MSINEDFHTYIQQRGQELAAAQTTKQNAYEQLQQRATQAGEIFGELFAEMDAQTDIAGTQERQPANPAENDFNTFFGL
ncbi:hypothetical protein NicSoilE8_27200 [Arthrobacter sp. NicSoilE8]|nr:hypothetical protein NicSoilE8_27200 [Arthrobacter sp. NicSoilE8]